MSSCASCSTDSSRANSLCAAACAARFSQQSCAATAVPGAVQLVRVEFDGTAADENHLIIIENYIIIILVRNSSARASLYSAPSLAALQQCRSTQLAASWNRRRSEGTKRKRQTLPRAGHFTPFEDQLFKNIKIYIERLRERESTAYRGRERRDPNSLFSSRTGQRT
jgi:hypothetical protein